MTVLVVKLRKTAIQKKRATMDKKKTKKTTQMEMVKEAIREHRQKIKEDPLYKKECEAMEESAKKFFYNADEEEE